MFFNRRYFLSISLFLLISVILTGEIRAKSPADSVKGLVMNADRALYSKKYNEAREGYVAALSIDSTNHQALVGIGLIYIAVGRPREAKPYLERADKLYPDDPEVSNNLGVIYHELGLSGKAVQFFEKASRIAPDNAVYCRSYGAELARMGRIDEAMTQLRQSRSLDADNAEVYFFIGNAFSAQQQYDSAEFYYLQSIRRKKSDDNIFYFLATSQMKLQKFEDAENNMRLSIASNPGNKNSHHSLGLLFAAQQRYDEAVPEFEEAVSIDSTFYPAWISLGAAYYLTDQFARSDSVVMRLLKVDSSYVHQMLGIVQRGRARREMTPTPDSE